MLKSWFYFIFQKEKKTNIFFCILNNCYNLWPVAAIKRSSKCKSINQYQNERPNKLNNCSVHIRVCTDLNSCTHQATNVFFCLILLNRWLSGSSDRALLTVQKVCSSLSLNRLKEGEIPSIHPLLFVCILCSKTAQATVPHLFYEGTEAFSDQAGDAIFPACLGCAVGPSSGRTWLARSIKPLNWLLFVWRSSTFTLISSQMA